MKTNLERVTEFMDFSNVGAMAQLFVIVACDRYADLVLKDEEETRRQCKGSFISGEGLIAAAKEWRKSADKHKRVIYCPECHSGNTCLETGHVKCLDCGHLFCD